MVSLGIAVSVTEDLQVLFVSLFAGNSIVFEFFEGFLQFPVCGFVLVCIGIPSSKFYPEVFSQSLR